jgi:hypothetical protein
MACLHFAWDKVRFSPDGIPHLNIRFPDGGSDDSAILKPATSSGCNYHGHLSNDQTVFVAMVGGCPFEDTFEVRTS